MHRYLLPVTLYVCTVSVYTGGQFYMIKINIRYTEFQCNTSPKTVISEPLGMQNFCVTSFHTSSHENKMT
jgi:hypothetical protein